MYRCYNTVQEYKYVQMLQHCTGIQICTDVTTLYRHTDMYRCYNIVQDVKNSIIILATPFKELPNLVFQQQLSYKRVLTNLFKYSSQSVLHRCVQVYVCTQHTPLGRVAVHQRFVR